MKSVSKNEKTYGPGPQAASAGPGGFSIVPPAYGIDCVDSTPTETALAPAQASEAPLQLKGDESERSRMGTQAHINSSRPAQFQALAYPDDSESRVAPGQERYPSTSSGDYLPRRVAQQERVRIVEPIRPPIQRLVIQRALSAADVATLTARTRALDGRLDLIIQRLPTMISMHVSTDDIMDPIRAVTNEARNNAAAAHLAPQQAILDNAEAAITSLDGIVTNNQATFDAINSVYTAVPAASRDAILGDLTDEFTAMGRKITRRRLGPAEVNALRQTMERAVIPDNREMRRLRQEGAQPAMDRVAMLVQGGLVTVGNLKALYASAGDAEADHFGGSWRLEPRAGTGRLQWLNEWEFHVHATVLRSARNAVTGFTIQRGHIKPTDAGHALEQSIQITNGALLTQVQNDNQAKIIRWSETAEGAAILRRIRRGPARRAAGGDE